MFNPVMLSRQHGVPIDLSEQGRSIYLEAVLDVLKRLKVSRVSATVNVPLEPGQSVELTFTRHESLSRMWWVDQPYGRDLVREQVIFNLQALSEALDLPLHQFGNQRQWGMKITKALHQAGCRLLIVKTGDGDWCRVLSEEECT